MTKPIYDLIKIHTAYHPKGDHIECHFIDFETAKKVFNDSKDKSTYYYMLFNKETGQAMFRGRRKKVRERLIDVYSDSKETEYSVIQAFRKIAQKRKEVMFVKTEQYLNSVKLKETSAGSKIFTAKKGV